jgi:hypothetical protein
MTNYVTSFCYTSYDYLLKFLGNKNVKIFVIILLFLVMVLSRNFAPVSVNIF